MKTFAFLLCISLVWISSVVADELTELSEHLKVFQPLVGKTFKGEFADSTPEKQKFDVACMLS